MPLLPLCERTHTTTRSVVSHGGCRHQRHRFLPVGKHLSGRKERLSIVLRFTSGCGRRDCRRHTRAETTAPSQRTAPDQRKTVVAGASQRKQTPAAVALNRLARKEEYQQREISDKRSGDISTTSGTRACSSSLPLAV